MPRPDAVVAPATGSPLAAFSSVFGAVQADCAALTGMVLASPEGLVLASAGTLAGDTVAAAASHMAGETQAALTILQSGPCTDLLVWTASAVWALARMESGHVLLVECSPDSRAATVRLALARLGRDLRHLLE